MEDATMVSFIHIFSPLCSYSDQKITQVINCNILSVPQVRYCIYVNIYCTTVCLWLFLMYEHLSLLFPLYLSTILSFADFNYLYFQMTRMVLPGMVERYRDTNIRRSSVDMRYERV